MKLHLILAISLLVVANAQAQSCPHIGRMDRQKVFELLTTGIPDLPYVGVNGLIARLDNIAYLSSMPSPIVNLGLSTGRQAFELEYQAVVAALDEVGAHPPVRVQTKTRAFLAQALDSRRLGLAGTTLSGSSDDEARRNAALALAAVSEASKRLWSCYEEGTHDRF